MNGSIHAVLTNFQYNQPSGGQMSSRMGLIHFFFGKHAALALKFRKRIDSMDRC